MSRVFSDGKTFVDATPKVLTPPALCVLYESERLAAGFSLREFVDQHFTLQAAQGPDSLPAEPAERPTQPDIDQHITDQWQRLLRHAPASSSGADADADADAAPTPTPDAAPTGTDTLLPLPHPYVVPGGRFRELYYWDSYFTMLGLVADGRQTMAHDMLRNFACLIDRYGFIPNSSRSYMLSRSQPPFFFKMIECAEPGDAAAAFARYLPQLKQEHDYWMAGEVGLQPGAAEQHVVCMADGMLLNRYWDARCDPREESLREDVLTARASSRPAEQVYRDLRAGAESGWDFSSRWCADPERIDTTQTTSILPADLNALLWGLENAVALGCQHAGEVAMAAAFADRAALRRAAMHRLCWSQAGGHFVDFHWVRSAPQSQLTAAALVPLYVGLASQAQADATARVVCTRLLADNGLMTTLCHSGQQWDAPNGWAPLQWMGAIGLERYGHVDTARDIASRWTQSVRRVYQQTGRLLEKYDVTADRPGGGGEYATQDGFGWTNGVYVALQKRLLQG